MGKHIIDPKSSEILSIFQVFPCTTQIFGPKLLPALFLKKPWYHCPFEILEEALKMQMVVPTRRKTEGSPDIHETQAPDIRRVWMVD
jgi:hypothetical protein